MVRLRVASEDLVRLGVNEQLASGYDDTELRERIGALEEGKVDKDEGKGLSTNDYTDAEKAEVAKIEGIEEDLSSLTDGVAEIAETQLVGERTTSKIIQYTGEVADIANVKWYVKKFDVSEQKNLKVSGSGNYFLCAFYDSNNNRVGNYPNTRTTGETVQYNDTEVIVPNNATYMYVNSFNDSNYIQTKAVTSGYKVKGLDSIANDVNVMKKAVTSVPSASVILTMEDEEKKYIDYRGIVSDIANSNFHVVEVTDIASGDELLLYGDSYGIGYMYAFYDSQNALIYGEKGDQAGVDNILYKYVIVPEGAVKLAVSYQLSVAHGACVERIVTRTARAYNWESYKWTVMGDSLSAMNLASCKHYFDFIADRTGIDIVNLAVGGTGYKQGEATNYAFYQRANIVPECDIITIFGSGNDTRSELTLGNYTDRTTDTVAGCVNVTLDRLFAQHPKAHIGIIAPTPWANSPTTTPNNSLERYSKMLEEVAKYRGVPFLDLYHHSGLRPEDVTQATEFYSNEVVDGYSQAVHPNNKGQHFLYPKFMQFVGNMLGL